VLGGGADLKTSLSFVSLFAALVWSAPIALAQAGAPTQRAHIPGIPDGTSLYPKSTDKGDFVSIGCVTKTNTGEFRIVDWRGSEQASIAGAPPMAAREPLVLRVQGDQDMLNFQVGHEVEITGLITEPANGSRPAEIKAKSILYLSRSCWNRGTITAEVAKSAP
jgi:hypothetical protein